MTLQEAFPDFKYLHVMQGRLDKANSDVNALIKTLSEKGVIPPEVYHKDKDDTNHPRCVRFLSAFGWVFIADWIAKLYPNY